MTQDRQSRATLDRGDWVLASMDRDLGWLEFNRRVLHEAIDERTPLLERLKFLAIFSSNLDEFFMKRVGLLRRRAGVGQSPHPGQDNASRERLAQIRQRLIPMLEQQATLFSEVLLPSLADSGIHLLAWEQLSVAEEKEASRFFHAQVFPVLIPLALDPGHPFPYLSNLSTSLGVVLREAGRDEAMFARVKIPNTLPQWVALKSDAGVSDHRYVRLNELITHNLGELFPGLEVVEVTDFRITRNAEVELTDDDGGDLREMVEEELRQRKFEPVVRLELGRDPDPWIRSLLMEKFELDELDVYELAGELDYGGLMAIASLPIPELRDEPWTPLVPGPLADRDADVFALIRAGDLLFHHPYESFDASVEHFIRSASEDPHVLAIKMTVYRVGDDTPFVRSLIRAAENGKQVACIIELNGTFRRGAQPPLGTATRAGRGPRGLRRRGPEDPQQARAGGASGVPTACGATPTSGRATITSRRRGSTPTWACSPATRTDQRRRLPVPLPDRPFAQAGLPQAPGRADEHPPPVPELIGREVEHARGGRPARIIAKMNQLEDPEMCEAICEASRAGVEIDLIVRGFSCLRPGVAGITDRNVRILSIIGRFLEHSRIFYFSNGQTDPARWRFLHRLGRLDVPQPLGPDRGDHPGRAPIVARAALGDPHDLAPGPSPGLGHATRRLLRPAHPPGRLGAVGPAGDPADADEADPSAHQCLPVAGGRTCDTGRLIPSRPDRIAAVATTGPAREGSRGARPRRRRKR